MKAQPLATSLVEPIIVGVTVQPNAVAMETGLLLGLKARVNTAQGASPGLDRPPGKTLGLHGRSNEIGSPVEPRKSKK